MSDNIWVALLASLTGLGGASLATVVAAAINRRKGRLADENGWEAAYKRLRNEQLARDKEIRENQQALETKMDKVLLDFKVLLESVREEPYATAQGILKRAKDKKRTYLQESINGNDAETSETQL